MFKKPLLGNTKTKYFLTCKDNKNNLYNSNFSKKNKKLKPTLFLFSSLTRN